MSEEERIRATIRQFMESILLHNDAEKAMETVSENIIGIGMGDQGTVSNKKELRAVLERMNANSTSQIQVAYPKEEIRFHQPSFATASIVYEITTKIKDGISKSTFIQTIAAKKENDEWKLCLVQAIPMGLTQGGIENYPLKFADRAIAELKASTQQEMFNLINKSFSGGIFGTYITENYPLYFANDTIIRKMGYTRDEFYVNFAENTTKMIYEEDRERIVNEEAEYVAQGVDEYQINFRLITKSGGFIWIIARARKNEDVNGNPVLLAVTSDVTELTNMHMQLEKQNETILASIHYANKIQQDLLPVKCRLRRAFKDYSVIWEPKDIVGGDIYWLKTFEKGTVLSVCDCTGHGTPGALLTMLVSSTFKTLVNEENCSDTPQLLMELDKKISSVLNVHDAENECNITHIHDGCDAAILFIANDGSVTISSSGIHVFICDGSEITQIKGQRLHIGEGDIADKAEVKAIKIPANPQNKFYIASDGLYDQIGGNPERPFGYNIFKEIILKNHGEKQNIISDKIWQAFELHRGTQCRRDDVELITFCCCAEPAQPISPRIL